MIIETQNLTKRFMRHEAVAGLSLVVPEGAAVALIGANGAGKTTALRLLMNILRADAGSATILGVDSRVLSPADYARIGYVSESQKLPARLTVDQFFDYLRPLYPTWDRELETALRSRFDLPADRRLGKLSHGMRMKTCLAAVLPYRPALLVLDEPLSGLDALVRDEVLEGLLANLGDTTLLISSHELVEIEGFATHVAFMDKGRLAFQDTVEGLGGRFREIAAGFEDEPMRDAALPESWLSPEWNGRTLRFIASAFAGEDMLRRELTDRFGPLAHFSAAPMTLRDTSKALMRAYRKESNR